MMVELRDLCIGYRQATGNKMVLNKLNATFESCQLIALAGNNGTGKSTLLKTIAGVLPPLEGSILLNNKRLNTYTIEEISTIISVVLTDKIGGFNLTAFDVAASGRIPYLNAFGKLTEKDVKIVHDCLEVTGIHHLAGCLFDELSDGQKQKVLIAKSLAQQTAFILMDEPTAFLDYESRVSLFKLMKQLCKEQHKTILISSHDLEILFKNADKILYLNNHSSWNYGNASEIKNIIQF